MKTNAASVDSQQRTDWEGIDFLRVSTRVNRIKHLGLFSLWISIAFFALLPAFDLSLPYNVPLYIIFLISFVNIILLKIRRLNDFNLRGWWLLLAAVPAVGTLFTIAIFCIPGTEGLNRFGNKPRKASIYYKLMCSILPVIFIFFMLGNYLGITVQFKNWQKYNSRHFSIQFPASYKIENKTLYDVPYEDIECITDDLVLRVDEVDYSRLDKYAMQNLLLMLGQNNFLSDSNKAAEEFVKNVLINDSDLRYIKILSNERINEKFISGRFLQAKIYVNTQKIYIKSKAYLDKVNKRYYFVTAYYFDNSLFDIDAPTVNYYLNSFNIVV